MAVALFNALTRSPARLPDRITGLYWTRWNSLISLRQVPTAYSLLYLFAAPRKGSEGSVGWDQNDIAADIRFCRARGQRVVLTVGGAGQSIDFSSRTISTRFVDSVERIHDELAGSRTSRMIDGVDLNTFESGVHPDALEYVWIGEELKRRLGRDFLVTCPPAARSSRDKTLCRVLLATGALDFVAPQFYGGPGLSDPRFIVAETGAWVRDVASGDASRIVVGFGMESLPHFSTIEQIVWAWERIERAHPRIRGAYLWQHKTDAEQGWAFAREAAPLINHASRYL